MLALLGIGLMIGSVVVDRAKWFKIKDLAHRIRSHPRNDRYDPVFDTRTIGEDTVEGAWDLSDASDPKIPVWDKCCHGDDAGDRYSMKNLQELLYDLEHGRVIPFSVCDADDSIEECHPLVRAP